MDSSSLGLYTLSRLEAIFEQLSDKQQKKTFVRETLLVNNRSDFTLKFVNGITFESSESSRCIFRNFNRFRKRIKNT
jgi:hypothetical protein